MAANTNYIHITGSDWVRVSVDKANVKVFNPNPQVVEIAIAANISDLSGLIEGHIIDHDEEVSFNNLASGQDVYLKAPNGDAYAIVTATDARLASGGSPQTGLTDSQLRASPVPVSGNFYPDSQNVIVTSSPIIGNVDDTAASSDTANASLIALIKRNNQNVTTLTGKFPSSFGRSASSNSSSVVLSNEDFAALGAINEAVPASDTASSGLNGRLQRISQRLTTISGQIPATLGQKASSASLSVVLSSDQTAVPTTFSPSGSANSGIIPVATTVAASSLILKTSAGNLYGLNIVTGATAGYVMIFNSTTVPADGTVTPVKVLPLAATSGLTLSFETPLRFSTGITVVFSSTGPFTKTASATAFISGEAV